MTDPNFTAFYVDRRGAHWIRQVNRLEAMDLLRGDRFNAGEACIMDPDGLCWGRREYAPGVCDDARVKWLWYWAEGGEEFLQL